MLNFEVIKLKTYPKSGESWGRVKCLDLAIEDDIVVIDGRHEFYRGVAFLLRCQCGKEFKRNKLTWRGRKYHKDCGCGIASNDGLTTLRTISIPIVVWNKIQNYSSENCNKNASRAMRELLEVGLDVWEGRAVNAKS